MTTSVDAPAGRVPPARAPLPLTDAESVELTQTLQLVADTITASLGFGAAVVNLVLDEDTMVVGAVSGPDELREALLRQRQGRDGWEALVAASEAWGSLRFIDHALMVGNPADMLTWIPDLEISDEPDAWHPEDALFAPLTASDGRALGVLSVDLPRDGRRPGPETRRALEAFAVTASLAIQHAELAAASRRSAARFQGVFDASPVAIGLADAGGVLVAVNDAFCRFLGRRRDEVLGQVGRTFSHPEDAIPVPELDRRLEREVGGRGTEKRYLLPDGTTVWGRLHLTRIGGEDEPTMMMVQIEDITERKAAEARLVHQASTDALTGLPNRAESVRQLCDLLERGRRTGRPVSVFFCDLDRLKRVNDEHGHAAGDAYIREVGHRLRAAVRTEDLVGRLSGDELVVVLPDVAGEEALLLADRVAQAVRAPLVVGGVVVSPSVSLGVATAYADQLDGPGDAVSRADELLAHADTAMYRAKLEGRGTCRVYEPGMLGSGAERDERRAELADALRLGQLVLHTQPVVELPSRRVVGSEALLRWQHPRRGLLLPADFLDDVLGSPQEGPLTEWVLRTACAAAAADPALGVLSVDVSTSQLLREDLAELVLDCLAGAGLPASRLVLEVGEGRLLTHDGTPPALAELRRHGVRVALDDVGSSAAGMRHVPRAHGVDVLKLDPSFAADLDDPDASPAALVIVAAVRDLATTCGLQLVVEGVETESQAAALAALGVTQAQGTLFGAPAPLRQEPLPVR